MGRGSCRHCLPSAPVTSDPFQYLLKPEREIGMDVYLRKRREPLWGSNTTAPLRGTSQPSRRAARWQPQQRRDRCWSCRNDSSAHLSKETLPVVVSRVSPEFISLSLSPRDQTAVTSTVCTRRWGWERSGTAESTWDSWTRCTLAGPANLNCLIPRARYLHLHFWKLTEL